MRTADPKASVEKVQGAQWSLCLHSVLLVTCYLLAVIFSSLCCLIAALPDVLRDLRAVL